METIYHAASPTTPLGSFGGADVLALLPDAILDDLTTAIDAFEPLELALGDWESVEIDPVVFPVNKDAVVKQERPVQVTLSPPPRPPMKNPSRERLRAELKLLRQRVVQMEHELAAAKAQQTKRVAIQWDQVAHDELRKRQRAEALNRQLGSALTNQTRVAQRLERLLRDNHGADAFARFCDMEKSAVVPLTKAIVGDEDALLARLEDEVVRAFATLDHVLAECNMDAAEVRFTEVKTTTRTTGHPLELELELMDATFVPFDFGRTCDASWRALSTAAVYKHHDVDMLVEAGNTVRFKSRLSWNFNGEQRRLRCVVVMKRYTTADRMVVVWRGATTSEDATASEPWVATGWEETGWIVVREIATRGLLTQESDAAQPCVLQTITRLMPRWQTALAPDAVDDHEIGAFSNMVLSAAEGDVTNITSAMQSLLLAEVLDGVSAAVAHEP